MADIWFRQLDCGPGEVSGGNGPACNLDDEYATTLKDLEDDGTCPAKYSLVGVWEPPAPGFSGCRGP